MNTVNTSLLGKQVGVSISNPKNLAALGYGSVHLQDANVEFSRHLLHLGADLVYGHDLRLGGYARLFHDTVKVYTPRDNRAPSVKRLTNYLAYPFYQRLKKSDQVEFKKYGVNAPEPKLPSGLEAEYLENNRKLLFIDPEKKDSAPVAKTPEAQYYWSLCLTQMREIMTHHTQVRIFLGGPAGGASVGVIPGLFEEGRMAINDIKSPPVYLIGAFGGATRAMIEALQGQKPKELTEEYQVSQFPEYGDFLSLYRERQGTDSIDYKQITRELEELGLKGLSDRNGLSIDENERLFETPHISEMVRLVLKGLDIVFNKSK